MQDKPRFESELLGKPTNFLKISCHGAKFDNIVNSTAATMPSAKELKVAEKVTEEKVSLFGRIFGKIPKQ